MHVKLHKFYFTRTSLPQIQNLFEAYSFIVYYNCNYIYVCQFVMGLAGAEPDECVKDYIKKYYYLYLRGVYWLNGSDDLMFETSVKLANMVSKNMM